MRRFFLRLFSITVLVMTLSLSLGIVSAHAEKSVGPSIRTWAETHVTRKPTSQSFCKLIERTYHVSQKECYFTIESKTTYRMNIVNQTATNAAPFAYCPSGIANHQVTVNANVLFANATLYTTFSWSGHCDTPSVIAENCTRSQHAYWPWSISNTYCGSYPDGVGDFYSEGDWYLGGALGAGNGNMEAQSIASAQTMYITDAVNGDS